MRTLVTMLVAITAITAVSSFAAPGDPVPGIGITVEQGPPSAANFGLPGLPPLPGDFFGPGSEPFVGQVTLLGECSHGCGGCDDDCDGTPDSQIDYAETSSSSGFATEMLALSLYSASPIQVSAGGAVLFFDVTVRISGQAVAPDAPATGAIELPTGASLLPGSSSFVVDSFFDITYRIEFSDPVTGSPAGTPLESTLRLDLQDIDLPVHRLDNGSGGGAILLGSDGVTSVPFTYASAGGGLQLTAQSIAAQAVTTEYRNWGTVKSLFR